MNAYRKIKKEVYDTAKVTIYYKLKYLKDSTRTGAYTEAQTVLQLSDRYAKFGDYYQLVLDSIESFLGTNRKNARNKEARAAWNDAIYKINYFNVSVTDLVNYETKIQLYDMLHNYEYTFTPHIDWHLAQGDTTINNVPCRKATCRYAGRDYIAWYAESINMPYGPYIFNGLPGLVMEIRDTSNNWIFTNNGIEKTHSYRDMYLYKKKFYDKIIYVTREEALSACRNETENFDNLAMEVFKVKTKVNGKWVSKEANYPRRPSNMLELEW